MPAPEALQGDFTGETPVLSGPDVLLAARATELAPTGEAILRCFSKCLSVFLFEKFRSFVLKTFLESVPSILKYDIPVGCPQFEGLLLLSVYDWLSYLIKNRLVVLSFSPMDDDNPH